MRELVALGLLLSLLTPGEVYAQTVQDGVRRFGAAHSVVAIATTSTAAVAANATRNFLLLENISDTNIDCAVGSAAVAGQGIRLYANGGSLILDVRYPVAAVNCIHAGTGSKSLLVTEGSQL